MKDWEFSGAFDERLNRPACLRRIRPTVPRREYEAAARLSHPNILAIYSVRRDDLLTEAVAGTRLSDFLNIPGDRRAFTARFQEMLVGPLLRAVSYAHEHGVIHGFLHPGNIWLFPHDGLKVWGFGFARLEAGQSDPGWQYASPDVRRGEKPTRRSDIWSVGAVLHLLFRGRPPGEARGSSIPDWVHGCLEGRYSEEMGRESLPCDSPAVPKGRRSCFFSKTSVSSSNPAREPEPGRSEGQEQS
ncbi:MAG: protein kinase [Candidatus Eremiobacteraeota bacterium]|nr:protein kinase [Candidatus Eremiobacteraeota bacterium]MCW5871082.1 protein kinase [Candidatus Eremiobacteraeota bacterium]